MLEPNSQVMGHWTKSRARLFKIIEDLVLWENTTKEAILQPARAEIQKAWRETCELNKNHPQGKELFDPERMPGLHDPFAGGGSIPVEAQRLGLEVSASDLNPVAVLINKAMIEIPPKFAGKPPVHPDAKNSLLAWNGATGLAEDIRRYGAWVRQEAFKQVGHLYPPIKITKAMTDGRPDLKSYEGTNLTVIAWLWVRTVKSPNPAFSHVDVPLASTFILSSKSGKEVYVDPVIEKDGCRFTVKIGKPPTEAKTGTKSARGSNFRCLVSGSPISPDYVMSFAKQHGLGMRLMAIVAEGTRGRVYLPPLVDVPSPESMPDLSFLDVNMTNDRRWFSPPLYGMPKWRDIFTPRQLISLSTIRNVTQLVREYIRADAVASGLADDELGLDRGGIGAKAYAEAVSVYLAFAISRVADYGNSIATWRTKDNAMRSLFSKQAIPMSWDFAEGSPFAKSSSGYSEAVAVKMYPAYSRFSRLEDSGQLIRRMRKHKISVKIGSFPPILLTMRILVTQIYLIFSILG